MSAFNDFVESPLGDYMESPLNDRNAVGVADLFVATRSTTAATGLVYGLNASDGSKVWTFNPGGRPAFHPVSLYGGKISQSDDHVYIPVDRNSSFTGATGNASVLVLTKAGSLAYAIDTGISTWAIQPFSNGDFVVVGTGSPNVFRYQLDGTLVWSTSIASLGNRINDVTIDHNGDVIVSYPLAAGLTNLDKLNGSTGAVSVSYRVDGSSEVYQIDADGNGTIYCAYANSGLNRNLAAVINSLTAETWKFNITNGTGSVYVARTANTVGLECYAVHVFGGSPRQLSKASGVRDYSWSLGGSTVGYATANGGGFQYVGFSQPSTAWEGSGGASANLVQVDDNGSDFDTVWGVALTDVMATERVLAISAGKLPNS